MQEPATTGGGGGTYFRAPESVTDPFFGLLTVTSEVDGEATAGDTAVMSVELWKYTFSAGTSPNFTVVSAVKFVPAKATCPPFVVSCVGDMDATVSAPLLVVLPLHAVNWLNSKSEQIQAASTNV